MANISLTGSGFQTIGFETDPINPKNIRIVENDGSKITIRFEADFAGISREFENTYDLRDYPPSISASSRSIDGEFGSTVSFQTALTIDTITGLSPYQLELIVINQGVLFGDQGTAEAFRKILEGNDQIKFSGTQISSTEIMGRIQFT